MATSSIEWTDATWNPVTGCSKISPGCANCYAESFSNRLRSMNVAKYRDGFAVRCHEYELSRPMHSKKPRRIFVNSMSDLFHEEVPFEFIERVFSSMANAYWHQFQILTKRSQRLLELRDQLPWPKNIWMGVSVESEEYTHRIDDLRKTSSAIKFLSLEPLLGPLKNLDLDGIDWVIVGGESGPRARPMDQQWIIDIRDQCIANKIPFFFKQWGGTNKKLAGRLLEGNEWNEFPSPKPS